MIATLHQVSMYLADTTVTTGGITSWLKDNAFPVMVFILGLGLLMKSHKGDHSGVLMRVGLLIIALAVITIGLDATTGLGVGKWVLSLFGIK